LSNLFPINMPLPIKASGVGGFGIYPMMVENRKSNTGAMDGSPMELILFLINTTLQNTPSHIS